jgi:hypothetical protein
LRRAGAPKEFGEIAGETLMELTPVDVELRLDRAVQISVGRRRRGWRMQPQKIERIVDFVRGHYRSASRNRLRLSFLRAASRARTRIINGRPVMPIGKNGATRRGHSRRIRVDDGTSGNVVWRFWPTRVFQRRKSHSYGTNCRTTLRPRCILPCPAGAQRAAPLTKTIALTLGRRRGQRRLV